LVGGGTIGAIAAAVAAITFHGSVLQTGLAVGQATIACAKTVTGVKLG